MKLFTDFSAVISMNDISPNALILKVFVKSDKMSATANDMIIILCKYTCAYFRNRDINTYSAHVYVYTLNSSNSGIELPRYV